MSKDKKDNITKKRYGPENADDQSSNAKDANDYVSEARDKQTDMEGKREYSRKPGDDPDAHSRDYSEPTEGGDEDRTKKNQ